MRTNEWHCCFLLIFFFVRCFRLKGFEGFPFFDRQLTVTENSGNQSTGDTNKIDIYYMASNSSAKLGVLIG